MDSYIKTSASGTVGIGWRRICWSNKQTALDRCIFSLSLLRLHFSYLKFIDRWRLPSFSRSFRVLRLTMPEYTRLISVLLIIAFLVSIRTFCLVVSSSSSSSSHLSFSRFSSYSMSNRCAGETSTSTESILEESRLYQYVYLSQDSTVWL